VVRSRGFLLLTFRLGALERKLGFPIVTTVRYLRLFCCSHWMSFFIALGPLGILKSISGHSALYRAWYALLPGFDSVRAIAESGVLTAFALSVLLGLIAAHYSAAFPKFSKLAFALPLLLLVKTFTP